VIRAAGGVVVRDGRVLIVHRPKYDDWTLPKGKCKDGESTEECALREVEEETGLTCEIMGPAGETRYRALKGPKIVHYFRMRALGGRFVPHDEVDDVRWATVEEAADALSYGRDAELLSAIGVAEG
jgi:8-oxo-dGTP pyrophosphatase MutT (NUDIX family)